MGMGTGAGWGWVGEGRESPGEGAESQGQHCRHRWMDRLLAAGCLVKHRLVDCSEARPEEQVDSSLKMCAVSSCVLLEGRDCWGESQGWALAPQVWTLLGVCAQLPELWVGAVMSGAADEGCSGWRNVVAVI